MKMFYKYKMEMKMLDFEIEQCKTKLYMCEKNSQLYKDASFWNELASIYNNVCMFKEVDELLRIIGVMIE